MSSLDMEATFRACPNSNHVSSKMEVAPSQLETLQVAKQLVNHVMNVGC